MNEFGLTLEQTKLMFSLQYQLVLTDLDAEKDYDKKSLKREWLSHWKESTEVFLKNQNGTTATTDLSIRLTTQWKLVTQNCREISYERGNLLTCYLILLEVSSFTPYYSLGVNQDEQFKHLKIYDREKIQSKLELIAILLGLDKEYVQRLQSNYRNAIQGISGKGLNRLRGALVGMFVFAVAAVFFTPVIAGALAPILAPGLYGAAAVSAVLASLGGGAIAVGGFGMAGGLVVLVGGGAILGGGAGAGIGALFSQSPDIALTQAAKLEVVMKEIVWIQKDIRLAQEIIKKQRQAIRLLEDQRDDLLLDKEKNKKEIENLRKAIAYLKKAIERNQELL